MKEKRVIMVDDVRQSCINHRWYTEGNIEEYDKMMSYVMSVDIATTAEIAVIATDIKTIATRITKRKILCSV